MARKRYSDEDVLNLLRQIELSLTPGSSVERACRSAGVSDAAHYNWRKKYGGMGKSQLQELKGLEKENGRLKRIVATLELDKLILKESLEYLVKLVNQNVGSTNRENRERYRLVEEPISNLTHRQHPTAPYKSAA
ncbi:MAG: hypothetical protein COA62_15535 [Rhodobiaceae bacterium]|nr:MAG: hypothetical protein COA62_15535 [Rhodobiaceae bacterium]